MSRLRRTPVNFPRMKVRGKRNRSRLAARRKTVLVLPHVFVGHDPASPGYTIFAAREKGPHRLEIVQVVDGYGRVVPAPRPPSRAEIAAVVEKTQPRLQWSMEFKTKTPLSDELRALIFGKET